MSDPSPDRRSATARRPRPWSIVAASIAVVLGLTLGMLIPATPAAAGLFKPNPNAATQDDVRLPNGDTMHYREQGDPAAQPVLFIHGWPTSSVLYEDVMDRMCGSSGTPYRCLAIDQIGFGQSSCPGNGTNVDPAYLADRLTEFIEVMDLEELVVVVHDWGGPTGMAAALRQADRVSRLVILNTSIRMGSDGLLSTMMNLVGWRTNSPMLLTSAIYPLFVETVMQGFTSTWLNWSERRAYSQPYRQLFGGNCRMRAGLNLFGSAPQMDDLYEEIEEGLETTWAGRPARFLWGSDDLLMGPNTAMGRDAHDEMASRLPQAQTVVIEGANHFMAEDRPTEIATEIERFLDEE